MIHVDSSFAIDLLREQRREPGPASTWVEAHPAEALGLSVFVACELEAGAGAAAAAHPGRERTRVREFLNAFTVVFPDDRFAATCGALLARMQPRGRTIGIMDLLIASTAIIDRAPLLTSNRRHFDAVPDLTVLSYR